MSWDKGCFVSMDILKTKRCVQVGNGQKLEVKGVGKVLLWAYNREKMIDNTVQCFICPRAKIQPVFSRLCPRQRLLHVVR